MVTKYWRLKLKGQRSVDDIHCAVGRSGGIVVRVHVEGGETSVYLAAEESLREQVREAIRAVGPAEEVGEQIVKMLG
jgi:hypothetical protein